MNENKIDYPSSHERGAVVYHSKWREMYTVHLDYGDNTVTVQGNDKMYSTFYWAELVWVRGAQ